MHRTTVRLVVSAIATLLFSLLAAYFLFRSPTPQGQQTGMLFAVVAVVTLTFGILKSEAAVKLKWMTGGGAFAGVIALSVIFIRLLPAGDVHFEVQTMLGERIAPNGTQVRFLGSRTTDNNQFLKEQDSGLLRFVLPQPVPANVRLEVTVPGYAPVLQERELNARRRVEVRLDPSELTPQSPPPVPAALGALREDSPALQTLYAALPAPKIRFPFVLPPGSIPNDIRAALLRRGRQKDSWTPARILTLGMPGIELLQSSAGHTVLVDTSKSLSGHRPHAAYLVAATTQNLKSLATFTYPYVLPVGKAECREQLRSPSEQHLDFRDDSVVMGATPGRSGYVWARLAQEFDFRENFTIAGTFQVAPEAGASLPPLAFDVTVGTRIGDDQISVVFGDGDGRKVHVKFKDESLATATLGHAIANSACSRYGFEIRFGHPTQRRVNRVTEQVIPCAVYLAAEGIPRPAEDAPICTAYVPLAALDSPPLYVRFKKWNHGSVIIDQFEVVEDPAGDDRRRVDGSSHLAMVETAADQIARWEPGR